jgi:hypothetical protein
MNLNDDVVYRCPRLGPLRQLHPGRSGSLVRYHDRLHHLPLDVWDVVISRIRLQMSENRTAKIDESNDVRLWNPCRELDVEQTSASHAWVHLGFDVAPASHDASEHSR